MTCDITMTPPTTQNGPLRHFLQFKDFSSAEIAYVLDRARLIKEKFKRYEPHMPLHDRTLAMVFEKPAPVPASRSRPACTRWAARSST